MMARLSSYILSLPACPCRRASSSLCSSFSTTSAYTRTVAATEADLGDLGRRAGAHLAAHYQCSDGGAGDSHGDVRVNDGAPRSYPHCILLTGHPGAGKTVFARGLIRELADVAASAGGIPSPTFCLDFGYPIDAERHPALAMAFPHGVHHLDLYRLSGATRSDLQSLDFFELTERAVMLVEWPDRLGHAGVALPGALKVNIQLQDDREKEDGEGDGMLTEAMMEKWISQPRTITLTPTSASSSVWSQLPL